jgi:signal transduction histidine kinase
VVAHDLRNPLNVISMQAQILRRHEGAGSEPGAVDTIRRAVACMNKLIQDLLDVARLDAGQPLSVKRLAAAPAALLTEMADQVRDWLTASRHTLHLDVAAGLPEVWADRARVAQVLDNLLANAVKFSPPDTRIELAARLRDGEVLFSVSNESKGIPAEVVPHVFDRFWQGEAGDRRGAGLGLSIARELVEAHGGHIWVDPGPPLTTFFFTLPR